MKLGNNTASIIVYNVSSLKFANYGLYCEVKRKIRTELSGTISIQIWEKTNFNNINHLRLI